MNLSPFLQRTREGQDREKGTGSKSNLTPRVAPFAAFIALLALQSPLEGVVDARWLVVARGLAAALLLAAFWGAYRELRDVPSTPARQWLAAASAGLLVAVLWIALHGVGWATLGERPPGFVALDAAGSLDALLLALRLFGFVLVVPLMEELFWRSFFMRWIDRREFLAMDPRAGSVPALALSSAVFALGHAEWLAALLAGLVFGTIYRTTGNLRASVASHAISNATLGGWILATHDWSLW